MHLHDALPTSDVIILAKGSCCKGEGEDNCREHLHSEWTDRGGGELLYGAGLNLCSQGPNMHIS